MEEIKQKFTGYATCEIGRCEYTGEFVEGVRQGFGKMIFKNYDEYEGGWDAGKMHGVGRYKFWNAAKDKFTAKYEGQFNHGVREGKGEMEYSNKDVYRGTWQNNSRTGEGICWFSNGDVFHGIWKFDKMVRGVYRKKDGTVYDGEIKNGRFDGYGKLFWPDGKWFEGIFDKGAIKDGMMFSPDRNTKNRIAEFKDGKQL